MPEISVTLITHNEEANICRCLESVRAMASEIVVVDSFSSDKTVEICQAEGCRVFLREFKGYGEQKQYAVDQAANDWVFSIDADEVVSEALRDEILKWKNDAGSGEQLAGYRIPFSLFFMGRILRHSGVGNEAHLRFFNRKHGRFTRAEVHEGVNVEGRLGLLKGRIIHYSYRDISHHLEKINVYTSQAATENIRKGKRYFKCWVGLKFPVSFFTVYFLKRGFLDGYPGFIWSFLAAFYASLKIAKTIELKKS